MLHVISYGSRVIQVAWEVLYTTHTTRRAISFPSEVPFDVASSFGRGQFQYVLTGSLCMEILGLLYKSCEVETVDGDKINTNWGKFLALHGFSSVLHRVIKRQCGSTRLSLREEGVLFIANMARVLLVNQLDAKVLPELSPFGKEWYRIPMTTRLLVEPWFLAWNSMETRSEVVSLAWFQTVASHPKKALHLWISCFVSRVLGLLVAKNIISPACSALVSFIQPTEKKNS